MVEGSGEVSYRRPSVVEGSGVVPYRCLSVVEGSEKKVEATHCHL
jgi:hypothetical protein